MISLGLVCGPKDSIFEEECHRVMKLFEIERKTVESNALINIVFHSPLSLKKADFTGMKCGAFSKKDRKILVAVAVPLEITKITVEQVRSYLHATLHEAADFGGTFLKSHEIVVEEKEFHEFIDKTMLEFGELHPLS